MNQANILRNQRQVANWLLIGVAMLVIQIMLGGVTRLTESGLSITEWKPITGMLPPLNDVEWHEEFIKYQTTDQFRYVHQSFGLSDFKLIFFWEWFHRLWARIMGMVFLIGFVYFLFRKKLDKGMVSPLIMLFILGALQGAIGWIMVRSGLVPEKYFVGHIELTTHFIAANILLAFTWWFAMSLLPAFKEKVYDVATRKFLYFLFFLIFCQFVYGGFMAGLKAGATAPTWPLINGEIIPAAITEYSSWKENLINNKLTIQLIHRSIAYFIFIFTVIFFFRTRKISNNNIFKKLRIAFLLLIITQVILGITTVLHAASPSGLVWFGVAHQFVAILVIICLMSLFYLVRIKSAIDI